MTFSYEQMAEMRKRGFTYTEIGKLLGVSRQRVHQMLIAYDNSLKGIRGHGFKIDTIVYKGIYEHFANNIRESLTSFTKKIYGHSCVNSIPTISKFITGKHNAKFTIPQLKKMCEVTGKTFEELFERR